VIAVLDWYWNHANEPEANALWEALAADPGAEEALVRLRMREEARARLPKRGVPERGLISISSAGR
jgi:hypothetical protein